VIALDFGFHWDTSYLGLPGFFYKGTRPDVMPAARMLIFNGGLAADLGLNEAALNSPDGAKFFGGDIPDGGPQPLAQAYAGHQFANFTMLGDGRALLYGEHVSPKSGRFDIHLKGAGQTAFSRRGDGRAALGPMLREYIISEAMHGLGIPTTRTLAVVGTGEAVYRQEIHQGAILVRVARSHLRVGTFEYAAAFHKGTEMVRELADYAIKRHHEDLVGSENRYVEFARRVIALQVNLITQWMRVGFVHGVMNTDNMAITGESIDFGPCAFMDRYDPSTVFSSIDRNGRYAFARQPEIAQWNLSRFLETLLPLFHSDQDEALRIANDLARLFSVDYSKAWLGMMRSKLGLTEPMDDDERIIGDLHNLMRSARLDYTYTFLTLTRSLESEAVISDDLRNWCQVWRDRVRAQGGGEHGALDVMKRSNPVYIPRNHLVEEALSAADTKGDFDPLLKLTEVLRGPYTWRSGMERYEEPGPLDAGPYRTFCGT
jgi:uncharacterized protein YdiU (UPF0061 family)